MSWNKSMEYLPRECLEALQLERLRGILQRVSETIPHHKQSDKEKCLQPDDIRSLDDLTKLPFTTKQDLRDHYPLGWLAVPMEQIVRVHMSSGTTGVPTVVGYTRQDMNVWGELMARTLCTGGVTASDVVHNAYGYGLFTGGLGFGLGAETIGAATVPVSGGSTKRQLMLMEDLGATVLCCTPSYALVLAETADEAGMDFRKQMKLRVGFMGAEPWSEAMRMEIETRLGIEAFDVYGLSELIGPGVAVECHVHSGLHIHEDHFLAEVIHPDTGAPLPDDSEGELVLTTLTKEGMPVIRYRTRDRVRLSRKPCACGRTLARMSKVLGRTDDMLIIRGVNIFPSQIEEVLLNVAGLAPQYQIVVDRKDQLDTLEVWVEATQEIHCQGKSAVRQIQQQVKQEVQQTLGIRADVRFKKPGGIQRSEGKTIRVIDRRHL